jgi:hypothetical protein
MLGTIQADTPETDRDVPLRGLWKALETLRTRRALRAARWAADTELALRKLPPLRLAWRVEELVSTKHRLDLAHSLRTLVRDASPRYVASATPINRLAVRAESETLLALASRVADLSRPVAARGIVVIERLLIDASGPLYDRERIDELPVYLDGAREGLEPR